MHFIEEQDMGSSGLGMQGLLTSPSPSSRIMASLSDQSVSSVDSKEESKFDTEGEFMV